MHGGVVWVIAMEWAEDTPVQPLDELVTHADGVGVLGGKRPCGVQHLLVVLDRSCHDNLTVRAGH
jgi:hypothetical protein